MRFTEEMLKILGYEKSGDTYSKASPKLQNPIAQCDQKTALGGSTKREAQSSSRITVRFTLCRKRPLDPDNGAGSVKDCLDGLRYAGLLFGDEAWRIRFEVDQEKVKEECDEKTIIEIIYPAGVRPPCLKPDNAS